MAVLLGGILGSVRGQIDERFTQRALDRALTLDEGDESSLGAELDNGRLLYIDLLLRCAAAAESSGDIEHAERYRRAAERLHASLPATETAEKLGELLAFHDEASPETRERVAQIHELIFEVLQRIADPSFAPEEMKRRAEEALAIAREIGYAHAVAEALYYRATALRLLDEEGLSPVFDEVEAHLIAVGDDYLRFLAALSQGTYEMSSGSIATAEACYRRGRLLMDRAPVALRIECLTGEAMSLVHLGRLDEALRRFREAFGQSLLEEAKELDQATLAGANLAQSLVLAGRIEEALEVCRTAERAYRGKDENLYYKLQRVRAYILFQAGQVEQAMSRLSGLIVIFGELGNGEQQAMARMQLGLICFDRGHYHAALYQFDRLEASLDSLDLPGFELARNDYHLGRVLDALGKHEQAGSYYRRGLERARRLGAVNIEVGLRRQLARRALGTDEPERLERALTELEAIEQDDFDLGEHEAIRGELLANLDRDEEALSAFRRSLELAVGTVGRVKARINLAQILAKLERFEEAEAVLEEAAGSDAARTKLMAGIFGEVRARIHLGRGEAPAAIEALEAAVEGYDGLRGSLSRTSDRLAFSSRLGFVNEALIALCHDQPETPNRLAKAFRASERAHARTLHDALRRGRVPYLAGERIAVAMRRIARLQGEATGASRLVPDRRALDRALRELEAAADDPILAPGSVFGASPVSLDEARALAGELELEIFEYFLGERRAFLLRIGADEVRLHPLPPPSEISAEVEKLRTCFDDLPAYRDLFERSARWLGRALLPGGELPERLVIVPHGSLASLPFDALLYEASGPSGEADYWLQRSEIVLAPSVSSLAALQGLPEEERPRRALLIGDPLLEPEASSDPGRAVVRHRPAARLSHAETELSAAAEFFEASAQSYRGSRATERAFKESLAEAAEVHLVCHGTLDDRSPLLSGLWLAPSAGEDGFLSAAEVQALETRARLVVLSACVTARGHAVRWDGVHGLTRAFFLAGARRVIASLWGVEDAATADLMTRFYRQRREGLAPSAALRRAKLELLEEGRSPEAWAGFILQGAAGSPDSR